MVNDECLERGHDLQQGMPWYGIVCLTCNPDMRRRCHICNAEVYRCSC